jgi:hypothetical protein
LVCHHHHHDKEMHMADDDVVHVIHISR